MKANSTQGGADRGTTDEIARLRHEAKHLRSLAKAHRADMAILRALPMGQKDPIAQLRTQFRINEYTMAAKKCDQRIKQLRGAV